MASTAQIALGRRTTGPLVLWHLLSLDAPTVAALWTWFVGRACHLGLPLVTPAAMALSVWILYAADRLLDARVLREAQHGREREASGRRSELEARHFFHWRYRHRFLIGIGCAGAILFTLLPRLGATAIYLYAVEGGLLVGWFVILHATQGAHRLPKELAVGVFFAAAIFIPSVARDQAGWMSLLPLAILFAALCSVNCLFIYRWEHEDCGLGERRQRLRAHASTRLALRSLPAVAGALIAMATLWAMFAASWTKPIGAACAISAGLLLGLDAMRERMSAITLRAAADLALLTPLAMLALVR